MYCKIVIEVTKTIADELQDLYTSHKDHTAQVNQSECFASSQQNSQPIRRCFASSKQTSQRQSPMYCKILTDVTKTIATSQPMRMLCQPPMVVTKSSPQDTLCKIVTNVHFTGVSKQFGNRLTFLSYLHVKMG